VTIAAAPDIGTTLGTWALRLPQLLWDRWAAPTAVPQTETITPAVVETLSEWGALPKVDVPPEPRVVDPPTDPVDAVAYLVRVLQIPQEEVLEAVKVAPRTFFGWKTHGRTARPASLGCLWPMVQVMVSLDGSRRDLAAWFHSSPTARDRFAAGDPNGLASADAEDSFRSRQAVMPVSLVDEWAPQTAVRRAPRPRLVSDEGPEALLGPSSARPDSSDV